MSKYKLLTRNSRFLSRPDSYAVGYFNHKEKYFSWIFVVFFDKIYGKVLNSKQSLNDFFKSCHNSKCTYFIKCWSISMQY